MKAVAIIADIVFSKKIPERQTFQTSLKKSLDEITDSSSNIISPYTITLGDEFQVLYKNTENILFDIYRITSSIHPYQIRFAIGMGHITTDINPDMALGMDGPAFHLARAGLQTILAEHYTNVQIYSENQENLNLINESLKLVFYTMENWSENTHKITKMLLKQQKVKEISKSLQITERAVNKHIRAKKIHLIIKLLKEINTSLNKEFDNL